MRTYRDTTVAFALLSAHKCALLARLMRRYLEITYFGPRGEMALSSKGFCVAFALIVWLEFELDGYTPFEFRDDRDAAEGKALGSMSPERTIVLSALDIRE